MALHPNYADTLLELANLYPSPHNGQPITLQTISPTNYEAYFNHERGLQSTEISFLFSFVTMGVFAAHLEACGRALGHTISIEQQLPKRDSLHTEGKSQFAVISITWNTQPPDTQLEQDIRTRQTSRKKYRRGLTTTERQSLTQIASHDDIQLHLLPHEVGQEIIWLNQRAVFDDMFVPAVREELNHWLRYSHQEKTTTRDGLSYDCMELNGQLLKFIVNHYPILRVPVLSWCIKQYYLRTMRDDSTVGYLAAPFRTEQNAFLIGKTIMQLWLSLTRNNYYLHPFGTIVANPDAHRDFLSLVAATEEAEESFVVFIFRAGASDPPIRSERIPYNQHLISPKEPS